MTAQRATSRCRHYRKYISQSPKHLWVLLTRIVCVSKPITRLRKSLLCGVKRGTVRWRCWWRETCEALSTRQTGSWMDERKRATPEECQKRVVSVTPQREQDKRSWHTLKSLLNKYRTKQRITSLCTYHWSRSISPPPTNKLSITVCTSDRGKGLLYTVHIPNSFSMGKRSKMPEGRLNCFQSVYTFACAVSLNVWYSKSLPQKYAPSHNAMCWT